MRILFLNHNVIEYGTYFRALALAKFFASKGHVVDFIAVSTQERYGIVREKRDGINLYLTPSIPLVLVRDEGWGVWDILRRLSFVLRTRYDIVYTFDHKPNVLLPALLSRLKGKPLLISDWCDWWGDNGLLSKNARLRREMKQGKPHRWIRDKMQSLMEGIEMHYEETLPLKYADLVTFICQPLLDRAISLGMNKDKVYLLPSGSNTEVIKMEDREVALNRLGFPKTFIWLGFLGNYHPDVPFLFEGTKDILNNDPRLRLLLITPNSRFLNNQIEHFELETKVFITGKLPFDSISPFLGVCSVLLLPQEDNNGNRGRLPNKFCDYIASGRPIVATDVGDVGRYIKEYDLGIVSPANPEAFSDTLASFIQKNEAWEDIGQRARNLSENEFNWGNLSKGFYKFLLDKCLIKS